MNAFSEYLIFVDESGSPTLKDVDPDYPLLVLAFLAVRKDDYARQVCLALQAFKFAHFGHDQVILHEREIRRDLGAFSFLKSRERKAAFLDELTVLVAAAPIHLVAVVVRKDMLKQRYKLPENPYHLALQFGLERVMAFLQQHEPHQGSRTKTHVIVECRGHQEDDELELEFRRICDGANYRGQRFDFDVIFADKRSNAAGLQLADLVARPIGMSVLRPAQANRAMDIVRTKLMQRNGRVDGWGLKVFP